MSSKKVLITEPVHEVMLEGFKNLGYEIDHYPHISYAAVKAIIAQYAGMVVSTKISVDKALLDEAKNLKFVGRLGSGMEHIDRVYAKTLGVQCFSSPDGNCNAVAEHAMGLLLGLTNNIHVSSNEVSQKLWQREKNRGIEIENRTVGIIAYGHTGSSFARKLKGFDVKVLVHDKYYNAKLDSYEHKASLEEIYAEAEIISLHLPLTDETFHLANKDFFNAFKKNIYFINTSRGKVLDTAALIEALDSGKVLGAGLDVLENESLASYSKEEQIQFENLTNRENVIVTPHIAGWSFEALRKMAASIINQVAKQV